MLEAAPGLRGCDGYSSHCSASAISWMVCSNESPGATECATSGHSCAIICADARAWLILAPSAAAKIPNLIARRIGNHILYSENLETEIVTFEVGLDALNCMPGDVIQVADANRAGRRNSGRISVASGNSLTLDVVPPTMEVGDLLRATPPNERRAGDFHMTSDNRIFISRLQTVQQTMISNMFPVVGATNGAAECHDLHRGPDRGAAGVRVRVAPHSAATDAAARWHPYAIPPRSPLPTYMANGSRFEVREPNRQLFLPPSKVALGPIRTVACALP